MTIDPDTPTIHFTLEEPARWEERSANRATEPGLERSRQIVAAAHDLLREEGLDGLTIRAVLRRTGLSRRAFYERFAGKDDLMLAVFEETLRHAASRLSSLIDELDDPLARLKAIVLSIVLATPTPELGGADPHDRRGAAMSREHMRLAESRPEDLQEALQPLMELIARQLSDGMARGQVRRADPQRLATLVYNLVSTTVHTEMLAQEIGDPDPARREALAMELWEFCRRAVAL